MAVKKNTQSKNASVPVTKKNAPAKKPAPTKKPVVSKLKSKKLEDRIAPGMLGGGVVDPGMAEAVDSSSSMQTDHNTGEISETQFESDAARGGEQPTGYLDETAGDSALETNYNSESGPDTDSTNFNDNSQYDEFSSGGHPEGFVDEAPAWQEADWVSGQADGSVVIAPPEGMTLDSNMASFPVEIANESLPLPQNTSINTDGSVTVALPEGTQLSPETNTLVIPEGTVTLEQIPPEMNAYENPDHSICVPLPEQGMEFNPETNELDINNYWANELAPANVEITETGTVNVELPEAGVNYEASGEIHLSPGAVELMDHPPCEYIAECEFAEQQSDGTMTFTPPEGVTVDGGLMEVPHHALDQMPIPEDVTINQDGTLNMALPEGATYNPDINGVVMPAEHFNLNEVPEGVNAYVNPDGGCTIMLPQGMEYDAASNSVHVNNYWANEISPDNIQINEDGSLNVALPPETEFFNDGSFSLPADHLDFLDQDVPTLVGDLDFASELPDGSYHFTPPVGMMVDPAAAEMTVPYNVAIDYIVDPAFSPVDQFQFNADGTATIGIPDGTNWRAETQTMTFPVDSIPYQEIPHHFSPQFNADGTVSVTLQDGMDYNHQTGELKLDNYWVNEMTPSSVMVSPEGQFTISLPEDTQFNADGSFTVPPHCVDFIANPEPAYITQGPDWASVNPDHSVTFETPAQIDVNPEMGTATMDVQYMSEQFQGHIPEGVHFNVDGTMNVEMPQGTLFDATNNALTFPEGAVHMNEIPEGMNANLNSDGSITLVLSDGMNYDPALQQMHLDNYWTNEVTPPAVEFTPNGEVMVHMPPDTHFYENGTMSVPEYQADFIDSAIPEFHHHGPDWITGNPDGSVMVGAPAGAIVDPVGGTMSMPADMAMDHFGGGVIPEEMTIHSDGHAEIKLPEGTHFDNATGMLHFPEGAVHMHEFPEGISPVMNADGHISAPLPPGVNYDGANGSVHISNALVNEMIPAPVEITPTGQCVVQLPPDTHFFEGNNFVIPAQSVDFMEGDKAPVPPFTQQMAS